MRSRPKRLLLFPIILPLLGVVIIGLTVVHKNLEGVKSVDQRANRNYLYQTIRDFQSMGERSSWQQQFAASQYLENQLEELGIDSEVQTYFHEGKEWRNISAILPGVTDSASELLAVAHYDSKNWDPSSNSPGADDNASGVAVLLDVARLLRDIPHQSTIRLVFFSNEEVGDLGSKSFSLWARETRKDIRAVLNIDVVGYDAPWALFSLEPISILSQDLPVTRKIYMIAKMANNAVDGLFAGPRSLKIMARKEDRHLLPDDPKDLATISLGRVRWEWAALVSEVMRLPSGQKDTTQLRSTQTIVTLTATPIWRHWIG